MRTFSTLSILVVFGGFSSQALAQVESGPPAGTAPKPFSVFVVTGDEADKTSDPVAKRKDLPTVYLFVPREKWDRPAARFIKTLDAELEKGIEGAEGAAAIAIWVTDEPAASKEYLPRAQQSLMLMKTPLTVFEGSKFGPEGWSLNDAAHLTAVVVRGGRVIKSIGFESLNETKVPDVIEFLKAK
jgi:hypothetical protein